MNQNIDKWVNDPGWIDYHSWEEARNLSEEASRPAWEHGNAVHDALSEHLDDDGTVSSGDFFLD